MFGQGRESDYRAAYSERKYLIHSQIRKKEKEMQLLKLREERQQYIELQKLVDDLPVSAAKLHQVIEQGNREVLVLLAQNLKELLCTLGQLTFQQWIHTSYILTSLISFMPYPQLLISSSHSHILFKGLEHLSLMSMYRDEIHQALLSYFKLACQDLQCIGVTEVAQLCNLVADRLVRYDESWNRKEDIQGCVELMNVMLGNDSRVREQEDIQKALQIKRRKFQCIQRGFYDDKRVFLTLIKLIAMSNQVLKLLINISYEVQRQQYKNIFVKDLDFVTPLIDALFNVDSTETTKSLILKLINNILQIAVGVPSASSMAIQLVQSLLRFSSVECSFRLRCEAGQTIANYMLEKDDCQTTGVFLSNHGMSLYESILSESSLASSQTTTALLEAINQILSQSSIITDEGSLSRIIIIIADIYNNCDNSTIMTLCLKILELVRMEN